MAKAADTPTMESATSLKGQEYVRTEVILPIAITETVAPVAVHASRTLTAAERHASATAAIEW